MSTTRTDKSLYQELSMSKNFYERELEILNKLYVIRLKDIKKKELTPKENENKKEYGKLVRIEDYLEKYGLDYQSNLQTALPTIREILRYGPKEDYNFIVDRLINFVGESGLIADAIVFLPRYLDFSVSLHENDLKMKRTALADIFTRYEEIYKSRGIRHVQGVVSADNNLLNKCVKLDGPDDLSFYIKELMGDLLELKPKIIRYENEKLRQKLAGPKPKQLELQI